MLNQFFFEQESEKCGFDFHELATLSAPETESRAKDLAQMVLSQNKQHQRFFHIVLNRILNARFEHHPIPPLDKTWQASLFQSKMIESWLGEAIQHGQSRWGMPTEKESIHYWFEKLIEAHPTSKHPIFKYLAEKASLRQIAYYIYQENPSDANFEDLVVSLQIGIDSPKSKMELARNYWDEMGLGEMPLAHTELYNEFLSEIRALVPEFDTAFKPLTEAIATGNFLLYSCQTPSNRYFGMGCLGVIEKLFSEASKCMLQACDRLDVKTKVYYNTHCEMDVHHFERWTKNIFDEMEKYGKEAKEEIAIGAMLRLDIIGSMYDRIYEKFGKGYLNE